MQENNKRYEDWVDRKWRPAMAWMYFIVCITDFIIFPILWAILQSSVVGDVTSWEPLTLKGAGLFHVAMGAILGITAWSRGQEKIMGVSGSDSYQYTQSSKNINRKYVPQDKQKEL